MSSGCYRYRSLALHDECTTDDLAIYQLFLLSLLSVRHTTLAFIFTKHASRIGPNGQTTFNTILNGGKLNSGNRLEYTAHLLHMNPLLCAAGWIGIMLIYRFSVMGEPFPDFLDPSDFMKRPLFRAFRDYTSSTSYQCQYDNHKKVFKLIDFISTVVLHLGRGSAQRDLFAAGICLTNIAMLARYIHSAQSNSYVVNVPHDCMVQRVDGEHSSFGISTFCPARSTIGKLSDEVVGGVAPYLISEATLVDEEYAKCGGDMAQLLSKCLINARGSLQAIRAYVEAGILLAASLPKDDLGNFRGDAPIWMLLQEKHPVFRLPFWSENAQFQDIQRMVRIAEKNEANHVIQSMANRNVTVSEAVYPLERRMAAMQKAQHQTLQLLMSTQMGSYHSGYVPATSVRPTDFDMDAEADEQSVEAGTTEIEEPVDASDNDGNEGNLEMAADSEQPEGESPPKKKMKQRKTRLEMMKPGCYYQSDNWTNIKDLWKEWAYGVNGGPAIRDLEKNSTKWRSYCDAARKFFNKRKPIYTELERLVGSKEMPETEAVETVERLHAAIPRSRKSKHSFEELGEALKEFHLMHGHRDPYSNSKLPVERKKSIILGDYTF